MPETLDAIERLFAPTLLTNHEYEIVEVCRELAGDGPEVDVIICRLKGAVFVERFRPEPKDC